MAHLLGAEALHLEYPTQVVFDSLTLGVDEGDRIGVVGRNGDGKSSLMGMLTGHSGPTSGRVTRRSGVRVGVLDQADNLDADAHGRPGVVGDRPSTSGPATPASATSSPAWSPTSAGTRVVGYARPAAAPPRRSWPRC